MTNNYLDNLFSQINDNNIILIDGSDIMYRAFFALPPLKSPSGFPTSAITGFLKILDAIKSKIDGYYIIVFDAGGKNHRHQMYPEYKNHRNAMPEDLQKQMPVIQELLLYFGYYVIIKRDVEADDILATLAQAGSKKHHVFIASHDKDMLQCVNQNITVYNANSDSYFDNQAVFKKLGVYAGQVVDYLALIGDTSDGFKGIEGVGPKTAAKWLNLYQNIDNIINNIPNITGKIGEKLANSLDIINRNLNLVKLINNVELVANDFIYNKDTNAANLILQNLGMYNRVRYEKNQLPDFERKNLQELKTKPHGLRYWFISQKGIDYQLDLFHDQIIYSSVFNAHELKNFLDNLNLDQDDYFWSTTLIYRLNINLSLNVKDVSLLIYTLDSSFANNDFLSALNKYNIYDFTKNDLDKFSYGLFLLSNKIDFNNDYYNTVERPLAKILTQMEKNGIKIDVKMLEILSVQINDEMQRNQEKINAYTNHPININSPLQLRQWIYKELNAKSSIKTKQGELSTSEEVLEDLVDEYPILQSVINYRMLSKLKSTYCKSLIDQRDIDDRVHTHYQLRGTVTGRLSSTEPNLQNIPIKSDLGKKIRNCFVAKENHLLLSADYSQIELRLVAHFSQDDNMLEALNSNVDIHKTTASWLFNIDLDEVDEQNRRVAKTINFGLLYGMSSYGLAKQLKINQEQAKELINKYFNLYPKLSSYRENLINQVKEHGYISTLLGRKIYVKNATNNLMHMQRLALNAPMQASASEIIKLAMIKIDQSFLKNTILLQVHDELVFEIDENELYLSIETINQTMTETIRLSVPLIVNLKYGKSWENMHVIR